MDGLPELFPIPKVTTQVEKQLDLNHSSHTGLAPKLDSVVFEGEKSFANI